MSGVGYSQFVGSLFSLSVLPVAEILLVFLELMNEPAYHLRPNFMLESNISVTQVTSDRLTDYIGCHFRSELAHIKKLPPRVRLFSLKSRNINFGGSSIFLSGVTAADCKIQFITVIASHQFTFLIFRLIEHSPFSYVSSQFGGQNTEVSLSLGTQFKLISF